MRATIEAFSTKGKLQGREEASACGVFLGKDSGVELRVTSDTGVASYRIRQVGLGKVAYKLKYLWWRFKWWILAWNTCEDSRCPCHFLFAPPEPPIDPSWQGFTRH